MFLRKIHPLDLKFVDKKIEDNLVTKILKRS